MIQLENDKNFIFASSLIKLIAIVIALMVALISRYAFIFFIASMLPTIFAIFFDRNEHRCLSATICSFNLIGVMPYLIRMWVSPSMDYIAKQFLSEIGTWMIIYGATFIGQLLYLSMPLLVVKLYSARMKIRANRYRERHKQICEQWGIDSDIDYDQ
jgi:hypothetical protein